MFTRAHFFLSQHAQVTSNSKILVLIWTLCHAHSLQLLFTRLRRGSSLETYGSLSTFSPNNEYLLSFLIEQTLRNTVFFLFWLYVQHCGGQFVFKSLFCLQTRGRAKSAPVLLLRKIEFEHHQVQPKQNSQYPFRPPPSVKLNLNTTKWNQNRAANTHPPSVTYFYSTFPPPPPPPASSLSHPLPCIL